MRPAVLMINPWIYDFAAFDLWARPLGLLYLGDWLKKNGAEIRLVDAMDRLHPASGAPRRRRAWPPGAGQWKRTPVETPAVFSGIPRRFARYGLPLDAFRAELQAGPRPDVILVTSSMTYWYPGVIQAISLAREAFPGVPVILGGTYATLCPDHAQKHSGADLVVSGPGEIDLAQALDRIPGLAGIRPLTPEEMVLNHRPLLDLYPLLESSPLLTTRGCNRRCEYCASKTLFPGFVQRPVEDVTSEIQERHLGRGLSDFVFFDDALLARAETHLVPILEHVIRKGWPLRFHVPNGLHVASITSELARLMFDAGFQTLRLGLESLDPERQEHLGGKVRPGQFQVALDRLKAAGFSPGQIGVYILYGLPGQPLAEVSAVARALREMGVRPYLAEYSPLPGTGFWEDAVRTSPFDLAGEPLYHNNSFFPCRPPGFSWEQAWRTKRLALGRSGE